MLLSDASIRRPVMATMITLGLALFGWIALGRLPVREMPEMEFPVVTLTVGLPGASAEVVEEEVTDLLEEQINTVEGLRTLTSESTDGGAHITAQFELEKNVDVAAQEVRDRISAVRRDLPDEVEEPIISKLDLDAQPIMWIALTSTDRDAVELTEYADKALKPQLERLPGIGNIILGGPREFAARIWLDADELAARQLTVQDVANALRTQNAEIPSGRIEGTEREFSVRTEGTVESIHAFNDLFLAWRESGPVYLRDVGRAEPGPRDERSIAFFSLPPDYVGRPAVGLGVLKQTRANAVDVAREVRAVVDRVRPGLPQGMEIVVANDTSVYVEEAVAELYETLIVGGSLAALIVFVFLASARSALVTTITIPASILSTFSVIYFLGFTINTLTMLALVLATGMVIDDAVVVVENIFRHREMGKSAREAAAEGTSEIAFAVIVATLSIAAVFAPLAFVSGMVGRLLLEFAVTVTAAMLVSMLLALTLTPMLASRFFGGGRRRSRWAEAMERMLERVENAYGRGLERMLRHRWLVPVAGAGTLVVIAMLFAGIGKELSPQVDEGMFFSLMKGPQGATPAATRRYLSEFEQILADTPEIRAYFTAIGLAPGGGIPSVNEAVGFVMMDPLEERRATGARGQAEVMAELRRRFAEVPGLQIVIVPRPTIASASADQPIQLVVNGPDIDALHEVGEELRRRVAEIPGIVDVDIDLDVNKPELDVIPDRARAADLGIELTTIADTLRILLGGDDITHYKQGGERYDVMVQLETEERRIPDVIERVRVRSADGQLVPLGSLVTLRETVGPAEIPRFNRARSFTLSANLEGKPLGAALIEVEAIARQVLHPDMSMAVTGQSDDMRESFESLQFTLLLAVAVVYMLLASQFNHFIHPLTIMLTLPLAMVGALGLLWALDLTLNLFSIIGILMLIGIATRNAILLVDYTIQLREGGMARDRALVEAGRTRLRPILMTALSTTLGVLPALVGLGSGAETRQPLAAAVVGGMITATALTLVVVPVVYSLLDDVTGRVMRRRLQDQATTPGRGLAQP